MHIFNNSIKIQKILQKANKYNHWIFNTSLPYCKPPLLDIGAALGNITQFYIQLNWQIYAIDIFNKYIEILKTIFHDKKNFQYYCLDICNKKSVFFFKNKNIQTITLYNVLEHIEDDNKVLENCYEILVNNGNIILLVPAFNFLYGSMDKSDNHFRRYSISKLYTQMEKKGFKVIKIFYFNFFGFFGWWLNGKILKRDFIPEKQLLFYDKIVPLLSKIEKNIKFPFGQSIFCIGKKI